MKISSAEKKYKSSLILYSILKRSSQLATMLVVLTLLGIIYFIVKSGISYINMQLLFGDYSKEISIRPALIGTLILIGISISTAVPIGVFCAIFTVEYTKNDSKIVKYIRVAVETLGGIPSIVYGLFGYIFFVVYLKMGYSLLGGGLTLAVMILPVIVRSTEESLLSVPKGYIEGAYALGTSKVRTIFKIILPSASKGIITAIILAIGRVISESAVLILTIGMVVNKDPMSILSPGTSLALDVYFFGSHGYPEQGSATGVVLLVIALFMNLLSTFIGNYVNKGQGEK